jgi:hypothetical protein
MKQRMIFFFFFFQTDKNKFDIITSMLRNEMQECVVILFEQNSGLV